MGGFLFFPFLSSTPSRTEREDGVQSRIHNWDAIYPHYHMGRKGEGGILRGEEEGKADKQATIDRCSYLPGCKQ